MSRSKIDLYQGKGMKFLAYDRERILLIDSGEIPR